MTSAGVAAGVDLCLHLVALDHGVDVAAAVARRLVMPVLRSGGQAQYIHTPVAPIASDLVDWASRHVGDGLTVDDLARHACVAPGNPDAAVSGGDRAASGRVAPACTAPGRRTAASSRATSPWNRSRAPPATTRARRCVPSSRCTSTHRHARTAARSGGGSAARRGRDDWRAARRTPGPRRTAARPPRDRRRQRRTASAPGRAPDAIRPPRRAPARRPRSRDRGSSRPASGVSTTICPSTTTYRPVPGGPRSVRTCPDANVSWEPAVSSLRRSSSFIPRVSHPGSASGPSPPAQLGSRVTVEIHYCPT